MLTLLTTQEQRQGRRRRGSTNDCAGFVSFSSLSGNNTRDEFGHYNKRWQNEGFARSAFGAGATAKICLAIVADELLQTTPRAEAPANRLRFHSF